MDNSNEQKYKFTVQFPGSDDPDSEFEVESPDNLAVLIETLHSLASQRGISREEMNRRIFLMGLEALKAMPNQ